MLPSRHKCSNQWALATFIALAVSTLSEGAVVLNHRSKQGMWPFRDPPHLRIPHHAFQTWLSGDVPDEAALAKWMGEGGQAKKPNRAMGAINRFRAKICWQMKDAHGEKFSSYTQCLKFMTEACRPGGDLAMDGDNQERPSRKGYCQEYFPEDEEEAEKELEELEAEQAAKKDQEAAKKDQEAAEAYKALAARKAKEDEEAKKAAAMESAKEAELAKAAAGKGKDAKEGAAKEGAAKEGAAKEGAAKEGAAAPAGAGAPAGAPAGAGLPADEAWYFKNDNKDPARYHMSEKMKLPTQGYWGELVEHDDMKTATTDWHNEFDETQSVSAICREHPDSAWCHKKGHGGTFGRFRSGSSALAISMAPILLMLFTMTSVV